LQAAVDEAAGRHAESRKAMTRGFEIAAKNPASLPSWYSNIGDVFRDSTDGEIVSYLQSVRSKTSEPVRVLWLDWMIAERQCQSEGTRAVGLEALKALQAQTDNDTIALLAYRTEGSTRYAAGDNEGAKRVWLAGLERFPNDWEMGNNLAFLLVDKMNDAEGALPIAEQAAQSAPTMAAVSDTLATVYMALGRLDEARQTLDQAERLAKTIRVRLDVMLNRARLELKEGHADRARTLINDAQEMLPTIGDARETYQTEIDELLKQIDSADD